MQSGGHEVSFESEAVPRRSSSPVRYFLAFLLCIANGICYADRTNIGIAAPSFVNNVGDRGVVLSAFFYGYILTQIPAGYMASRVGVKKVLGVGVLIWTLCDTSTILVSHSIPLLFIVRACMGCGEGVVMPSLHRFATNWFPVSERSTMVAVISSGSDLGTIFALLFSPWLLKISSGQWQYIFLIFGGFSLLWLPIYTRHVTSKPEQHPRISREEKEFILSNRGLSIGGSLNSQPAPWRSLLRTKKLWVIYLSHICYNYSWYVLLGWLPTYVNDQLGVDLKQNQLIAATPYIFGYFGLLVAGRVSDLLIARGYRTLHVRRLMNSISSFLPALCLFLLPHAKSPAAAIFLLSASMFTGRASTSGFWINMIDVGPAYASEIMGISNSIATLPGIFGNLITGFILQKTQNWEMVFHIASIISVIGGLIFACFSTDVNLFHGANRKQKDDEEMSTLNKN